MRKETYIYLEKEFTCKISDEPLSHILPKADIFLSSPSNALLWSLLCGIKTILFDFYGWNYKECEKFEGLFICKNKDHFLDLIENIIHKEIDMKKIATLHRKQTKFDGTVLQGYIELLNKPTNTSKPKIINKFSFFSLISHFLSYCYKKQLKKLSILSKASDGFYIAPFSPISQELLLKIGTNKFLGFIDKNTKANNIFQQDQVNPNKNDLLIIISPNHANSIKQKLATKFNNIYEVKYF